MGGQFIELTHLGKNGAARWIGGTLTVLFFWFVVGSALAIPFLVISVFAANGNRINNPFAPNGTAPGDPFWLYLGTNVTFIGIWLGLIVALRLIHHRPLLSLVSPALRLNRVRLAQGFGVWLVLSALFQAIEFILYPARAQFTFDAARWFLFLPFVLVLTPIQTSAEELLFRGYWLQGMGRLTRNAILLIAVNGILFGLPHMLNPEVLNNPGSSLLLLLNYGLTGAALALLTLRDNRLELALGAHAANNLFAALVVNYSNSALTTPAVFTNPVLDAPFGLVSLVSIAALAYLVFFHVLRAPAPALEPARLSANKQSTP